jgi:hypothetical protein
VNAVTPILVTVAILIVGLLALFAMLTIAIWAEGNRISSDDAWHSRAEAAARRILGVYVRRPDETTFNDTRK